MEQSQKPNPQPGQGQQIPSRQRNPENQDLPGQAQTGQRQSGQGQHDQRPDEDSRAARAESERRQGDRRQGERRQGGTDVERDDSDDAASKRS